MLADKDIDAAMTLLERWEDGDVTAKTELSKMSDKYSTGRSNLAMNTYPSISNPNFHELLQKMRQMYVDKLSPASLERLQGRTKALLRHQQLVKTYMSPGTGYNGILLVHDVGVGKTCTAVAIAEMYHATMSKPAIVLTGVSLKAQWKEEIAGVGKAQYVSGAWQLPPSCAGDIYDRIGSRVTIESRKMLEHSVHAAIRNRYEFYGYIEFNNKYRSIQSTETTVRNQLIRETFSDRVIIVDEAHHLRSSQDTIEANEALNNIVRNTSNVKIVLLTATPMFDKASEIINLLNIMRLNDGRSELNVGDYFDGDGNLSNKDGLAQACRGYISYVRGGDPMTFPTQLSPSVSTGKPASSWPKRTLDGSVMKAPSSEMIELVNSDASDLQETLMLKTVQEGGIQEDDDNDMSTRQISTIVYPGDGKSVEDKLKQCVSGTMVDGNMQYREGFEGMFGKDMKKYSPKIATVLKYLSGCKGAAMVYTFWIPGGILPMAFALEEAGYTRTEGPPLLNTSTPKNGKKYAIITGKPELTPDASKIQILNKMKDIKNADGSLISVVLVTQTVSEGVDLKNIREVHILDPWWNMGRPDQIIGRAARYMSHISLPESQRNVTIYNHVCVLSDDRESVDHVYIRRALQKRLVISDVLEVIRSESVDCAFNKKAAYLKPEKKITLETSQGRKIEWMLGDQDYSKACLYKKCVTNEKICSHDHLLTPKADVLFDPDTNDIRIVSKLLEYEFDNSETPVRLSLDEIKERLSDISDDILMFSLETLISTRSRFNISGTLSIMKVIDGMYLMVPVTARLVPLSTDIAQTAQVVELTKKVSDVHDNYICEIDAEVEIFTRNTNMSDTVVQAAVDAVVDRKSHKDLIALAKCGRSSVLKSMTSGGIMSGTVVSHNGKGYDIKTSSNVAAIASSVKINPDDMICSLKGGSLIFTTNNRGKACNNLKNSELNKIVNEMKFVEGDVSTLSKKDVCSLIEIHYRLEGKLKRPGMDAT